jgi:hypothetical protein
MSAHRTCALLAALIVAGMSAAWARPPQWLEDLAAVAVPAQDPQVDAVQLLSETELIVTADGDVRERVRGAVRILRKEGQQRAVLHAAHDSWSKVKQIRGWAIHPDGKSDEARMDAAIETALVNVRGGELITDVRMKVLSISGARPGTVVGYEFEYSRNPLEMADSFDFQDTIPVLEARYRLRLPAGWTVASTWINHTGADADRPAPNQWNWTVRNVPRVSIEPGMPEWQGVAGRMFLAFAPAGSTPQLSTWQGIGSWFLELSRDRRAVSPEIRAKAAELVAGKSDPLDRIRALTTFAQQDIRYVGIQLGIGGFQPHAVADIFRNRYGDCKDKSLLLSVLLAEAGIESVPVLVHSDRTRVRPQLPPGLNRFNHVILAIRLPPGVDSPSLLATAEGPQGERFLFFDPTDELTALGRLPVPLQGAHGLMVLADGGRLVPLPQLKREHNGVRRTATLRLSTSGELSGEVFEQFLGEQARVQRGFLRGIGREPDRIKPLEARLAESLAAFRVSSFTVGNDRALELPLEWRFSFSAESYARRAGNLLMVRPRLLGIKTQQLPADDAARVHDLMVSESRLDHDEYVIELPAGYALESLPQPVDVDVGFAAYRSRTELVGSQLRYSRSYEVRELLVPAARVEDYRRLQREIARDERAVVLLKPAG